MRIISPSAEIMQAIKNPQKHIENIARTCYKSNDLITIDSDKKFINNLRSLKHWAMLEHYIFIYRVTDAFINQFIDEARECNVSLQYMKITNKCDRNLISFSARTLLDLCAMVDDFIPGFPEESFRDRVYSLMQQCVYDYECNELFNVEPKDNLRFTPVTLSELEKDYTEEEFMVHGWKSVKFICDRGVSHEIVRHRDASFAQESTRYCSYNKDKFGNEITVIKPLMFNEDSDDVNEQQKYKFWKEAMKHAEDLYFYLIDMEATAQEARSVLPNSLKTEIIMTARNYEWVHFFELRCDKAAHPQMREVAIPLCMEFCNESNIFNFYAKEIMYNINNGGAINNV